MRATNVLLIGNYPPPFGGVPLHIQRVSAYLQSRGWNCHVLSGGTSGSEVIDGVTIHRPTYKRKLIAAARPQPTDPRRAWLEGGALPTDEPRDWRRYRYYADVAREIACRERIGIVASYNLFTYGPAGAWLASERGLPHIITNFGEVFKFEAMRRSAAFFRNVSAGAFRLLSCSNHCGRSLRELGIMEPVEAVTYGIDLARFAPGPYPRDLRDGLGIGPGALVLFVGRLNAEMGLDSFVSAAQMVLRERPDVKFLMVGQDAELAEEVSQACKQSAGAMTLVRNASYQDLPLYYRLADVLLVPTRGDRTCSSLAAMEAMATAVAVAGFAVGGVPEIVSDGVTGVLVAPGDVAALADATLRLLADDSLRHRVACGGYDQARDRLGEDHMNATMERHFMDALYSS